MATVRLMTLPLFHQAQLHPSKLELLTEWVPNQPWFAGASDAELANVASFRFDDPEGEVGVETILVRAGDGPTMQVPLTYRSAPLDGAEAHLIGTMEHSVLGKRWVYDGAGDPAYLQTTATAALNGGHQAELIVEADGARIERAPNALVSGTGSSDVLVGLPSAREIVVSQNDTTTEVTAGTLTLLLLRVIAGTEFTSESGEIHTDFVPRTHTGALTGTWTDSPVERELVVVSLG